MTTHAGAASLRIVHAMRTVVIVRDEEGLLRVYIATPVGWRLRREPGCDDGELVVHPIMIALLDGAADGAAEAAGSATEGPSRVG